MDGNLVTQPLTWCWTRTREGRVASKIYRAEDSRVSRALSAMGPAALTAAPTHSVIMIPQMTVLQVEQVTDAEDTMEFLTLTTLLPDVILLDVMMPVAADGLEVS